LGLLELAPFEHAAAHPLQDSMNSKTNRASANHQVDGSSIFLLVGSQRSGTNFLRELIGTNPGAVVHGEVLYPYPLPNCYHNFVRTMVSRQMPPLHYEDGIGLLDEYMVFLREDCKRSYPAKAGMVKALGLDVKYNQLRFITPVHYDLHLRPLFLEYCSRRGVPILHLVRTNVLHQALSMALAEARNVYHNYDGGRTVAPIAVEVPRVLQCARWVESEAAVFRDMTRDLRVMEISYERLIAACARVAPGAKLGVSARVMGEVANFLGLENDFEHPASIKKVVDRPYQELLTNYADVVAAVRGSEFEPFLDSI
jgi:hypothetical protein